MTDFHTKAREIAIRLGRDYPDIVARLAADLSDAYQQGKRDEREACAWQPIETAPKDGTAVMLITVGDRIPTVASWNGYDSWDDGDFYSHMTGFTHWKPLPSAPASIRKRGEA